MRSGNLYVDVTALLTIARAHAAADDECPRCDDGPPTLTIVESLPRHGAVALRPPYQRRASHPGRALDGERPVGTHYASAPIPSGGCPQKALPAPAETSSTQAKPDTPQMRGARENADEIVVTGTNTRGVAPKSSPTFVFDRTEIEQSGFLSTEQFIRSIPQVFGGGVNSASARGIPIDLESRSNAAISSAVNLRGLSSGATLTLLNGRRVAPAGTSGGFVDISAIPLSAIGRIEALTDGASSIYGGDAVSGVVNFVTHDDFDGAEIRVDYGLVTEDDLDQVRASQTVGANWGSGNALASYEFFDQDALRVREKSFARAVLPSETLLPEQQRHSVIAAVSQSITETVRFSVNGFYADRESFSADNGDDVLRVRTANTDQFLVSSLVAYEGLGDWRIALGGDYSETNAASVSESRFTASDEAAETRPHDRSLARDNRFVGGRIAVFSAGRRGQAGGRNGFPERTVCPI